MPPVYRLPEIFIFIHERRSIKQPEFLWSQNISSFFLLKLFIEYWSGTNILMNRDDDANEVMKRRLEPPVLIIAGPSLPVRWLNEWSLKKKGMADRRICSVSKIMLFWLQCRHESCMGKLSWHFKALPSPKDERLQKVESRRKAKRIGPPPWIVQFFFLWLLYPHPKDVSSILRYQSHP